jgi:hypothetical protein
LQEWLRASSIEKKADQQLSRQGREGRKGRARIGNHESFRFCFSLASFASLAARLLWQGFWQLI